MQKRRAIRYAAGLLVLALAGLLICRQVSRKAERDRQPPGRRTLVFPQTWGLGTLSVRDWESNKAWIAFGAARDRVVVPPGKELKLVVQKPPSVARGATVLDMLKLRLVSRPMNAFTKFFHFRKDRIGGGGPSERGGAGVVAVDELFDLLDQVSHIAKCPAPNRFLRDDVEPDFYLVQP